MSASRAARRYRAAPALEKQHGAVTFARTGDPDRGDFKDAEVIVRFGPVPDDLSEL